MVSNQTRGGLTPAKIINLQTNTEVAFMFNPSEFTVSKTIGWKDSEEKGVDAPQSIFGTGSVRTISLKLLFDTQDSGGDVTYFSSKLWTMTMIDSGTVDSTTKKGMPPPVAFKWGKLYFKAIITSISETFKLFDEQGVPLRSEVSIDLREYVENGDSVEASMSSGSTTPPPKVVRKTGVDRIDNVAAVAGLLSSSWRDVASANNIDNPLKIPTGTNITLP